MIKVLPSVVTTGNEAWRDQIREIKELGIKECAIFPNSLEQKERDEMYWLLGEIEGLQIPLVHAKHDMPVEEYQRIKEQFGVEYFNLHTLTDYPPTVDIANIRSFVLAENSGQLFNEADVMAFGGICLDMSHLESDRLLEPKRYNDIVRCIQQFGVKANHVGGKLKEPKINRLNELTYDRHEIDDVADLDYMGTYPKEFFGEYVALELINPISLQLEAVKYLNEIVDGLWSVKSLPIKSV